MRNSDFQVRKRTKLASTNGLICTYSVVPHTMHQNITLNSKVLKSISYKEKMFLTTLDCFIKNSDSYCKKSLFFFPCGQQEWNFNGEELKNKTLSPFMQLSLVMHSETLHFAHIFYLTALFILVQRIDFRKKQHILDSG